MADPQAVDEGGEAPCFAAMVDPETGRLCGDDPPPRDAKAGRREDGPPGGRP